MFSWFTTRRICLLIGLVLALAADAFVWFLPSYHYQYVGYGGHLVDGLLTALEINGYGVVLPIVIVPVVLVLVPLLVDVLSGRGVIVVTFACAAILLVLCILGLMSFGLFFLPAAIAVLVSAGFQGKRVADEPTMMPA
jgi:hypothetical protein